MVGLISLGVFILLGVVTLWIKGIDEMHEKHPDYKGEDLFNEEGRSITLKEKFEEIEDLGRYSEHGYSAWSTKVLNKQSTQCVKIADDYAIEFADWIRVCKLKQRPYDFENIKKLLEIYKEEKDL